MLGPRWLLLALIAATVIPSLATAGEFRDPSGFSFLFPDDWTAVTKANLKSVPAEVQERFRNGSFDLSKTSVVVVAPSVSGLAANVSVAVLPACLPINDKSRQELTNTIQKRLAAIGIRIEGLRSEVYRDGVREAIVFDVDSNKPASSVPIRQRQVYFTGGENTFVVTFTSTAEQFADFRPQFYMIQTSFRVPPLSAKGWWKMYGASLLSYILTGAIIVFLIWARRRASPPLKATAPSVEKETGTESTSE